MAKIYIVDEANIGIMPHPGGGAWLEKDMQQIQTAGINVLVSMLTQKEVIHLELIDEAEIASHHNIEFISFPIIDGDIPPFNEKTFQLIHKLYDMSNDGHKVICHCYGGVGRSATIALSVLTLKGYDVDEAITLLSDIRGFRVPETREQEDWVRRFAEKFS